MFAVFQLGEMGEAVWHGSLCSNRVLSALSAACAVVVYYQLYQQLPQFLSVFNET